MDRPEWIDTFPDSLTAIATLTNNTVAEPRGRPTVDAANPRAPNTYGHIIRWRYRFDFTGTDLLLGHLRARRRPGGSRRTARRSSATSSARPDGLYVAPSGRLWIQTDVSGSTINAGAYAGLRQQPDAVRGPDTREIRRFLVGPNICEITGVFVTPDERTMFVGIQHPGEAPSGANDPADPEALQLLAGRPAGGRPRSATIVITKDDGGPIGS